MWLVRSPCPQRGCLEVSVLGLPLGDPCRAQYPRASYCINLLPSLAMMHHVAAHGTPTLDV
jgi:hypothetical protein